MEEDIFIIDNLEVHKKDNFVIVYVNPKLYPLEVIYSAAYVFINDVYIVIDGNPDEEILIRLRPKSNKNLEELGREFNEQLLNYMAYIQRSMKNQSIREILIKRALDTNNQSPTSQSPKELYLDTKRIEQSIQKTYIDSPESISRPWESKNQKD